MNVDKYLIGQRIKLLRNEMNLTQEEFALKLGLNNKSSISLYEKGDSIPSDEIKLLICKVCNCTLDYLLGNSNIKNPTAANYDHELEKIGLSTKELNTISDSTKKEIKSFIEYIKNKEKK